MESISVLVVDDEPGIALLCKRILSRAGYDVLSETNPRVAIEHLQQKRFDLLVVDIRMPERPPSRPETEGPTRGFT